MLSNLQVSFEVECFVNNKFDLMNLLYRINRTDLIDADFIQMYQKLPNAILEHLENISGVSGWGLDENESSMDAGVFEYDDFFSFEFITPITNVEDQVLLLSILFEFMKDASLQTNETCGLHMNVSYDGIEHIDKHKLTLVLDENELLDMFGRRKNQFCVPYSDKKFSKQELIDYVNNMTIEDEKSVSINFKKLERGYIEFRSMGGVDYHLNDGVYKAMNKIIVALETASV